MVLQTDVRASWLLVSCNASSLDILYQSEFYVRAFSTLLFLHSLAKVVGGGVMGFCSRGLALVATMFRIPLRG